MSLIPLTTSRSRRLLGMLLALTLAVTGASLALTGGPARAADAPVVQKLRFTASDGTSLAATLTGLGSIAPRPTVVEFSPYGPDSASLPVSADYNYLVVQLRGTGDSDGEFDALGPRMQDDVAQALGWACAQPWSNGSLALAGFSASAIIIYNSLHEALPCVKAAVLKSGTFELYRDLLMPGGISNTAPGLGVLALIGAPALEQGPARLQRNPASALGVLAGLFTAGVNGGLLHPNLDSWWAERGFRGDVNKIPTLVIDGFYDVESRGAFQGYQYLRDEGADTHLLVVGGHDGAPAGTDDGVAEAGQWLDHYVRGVSNGVEAHPKVQLMLADGDREDMRDGDYVPFSATDWPVPGTTWSDLHLDPARSGSALSLNDGSLSLATPSRTATQVYPATPSLPTNTDSPTTALLGAAGADALFKALPVLTDMNLAESIGLTFSTKPLSHDVLAAGPLDLDVPLSTTTPGAPIWAVLSDVSPDGQSHPLTVGRLSTDYPDVISAKSLFSGTTMVQPYGDFSARRSPLPLQTRTYHVELWPVGNRFAAGHRIRLELVGASAFSLLALPGVNAVRVGGPGGAVLRFPTLPGSDLSAALG
ncbi:MAG: CocE/NonD family hydrolase [Marmoricola sp.]